MQRLKPESSGPAFVPELTRAEVYWLAKTLQTGMMPHPVYIPTGEVRELRGLLAQREALVSARTSWLVRAMTLLTAAGAPAKPTPGSQKEPRQKDTIVTEAFAKEVYEDQAESSYGSPALLSVRSSSSLVWPIRFSARLHVRGENVSLEHAWKDGDPRFLPRCVEFRGNGPPVDI